MKTKELDKLINETLTLQEKLKIEDVAFKIAEKTINMIHDNKDKMGIIPDDEPNFQLLLKGVIAYLQNKVYIKSKIRPAPKRPNPSRTFRGI